MSNPSEEAKKELDWLCDLDELNNQGYLQLCVWEGVTLDGADPCEFETWFLNEVKARIRFMEVVLTRPDFKDGLEVPNTGGRSDIFFYVHQDDIPIFSINRFNLGNCRWWEDVLGNGGGRLYPESVLEKYEKKW